MDQEVLQRRLAQFLVDDVFNTVSENDILREAKDGWMHNGILLSEAQVALLKKEAKAFAQSNLFPILFTELRYHARQKLERAETEADIISSKLLAYLGDVLKSKVEKIANL